MHRSAYLKLCLAIGAVSLVGAVATPDVAAAGATTKLISKASGGARGNNTSEEPSISSTGRYTAFNSDATNLVANDTNGASDCFVRDQTDKITERVSISSAGTQGNGSCWGPSISGTGRYVAFASEASNLVAGDTNSSRDIFVRDRVTGETERVSVPAGGGQANGISADPTISADGRTVAFESKASNLVPGDTNGKTDVFVRDLDAGTTKRVSERSDGKQANRPSEDPTISGNGRYVVFESKASNSVWKDTNGKRDIFIHDLVSGKTKRMSISSAEKQAKGGASRNATVNFDGRFVAFNSRATNLIGNDTNRTLDVFLRDRKNGTTKRVSVNSKGRQGNGWSGDPTISSNGRWIAFESTAPNLVSKDGNGKMDAFVRDRIKKTTKMISRPAGGGQARGGHSDDPFISADGRHVAFESEAKNIVKPDNNGAQDVYRRGPIR